MACWSCTHDAPLSQPPAHSWGCLASIYLIQERKASKRLCESKRDRYSFFCRLSMRCLTWSQKWVGASQKTRGCRKPLSTPDIRFRQEAKPRCPWDGMGQLATAHLLRPAHCGQLAAANSPRALAQDNLPRPTYHETTRCETILFNYLK